MGSFFYTEKDRSPSLFLKENSRKEIIPSRKINILLSKGEGGGGGGGGRHISSNPLIIRV